jgi:hypothetical protein
MSDNGVKSTVPQGLQLFYAMYAVTLVLGIQDISEALYKSLKTLFTTLPDISHVAVNAALFAAILLLIVRFFWSTGNIKRAWVRSKDRDGQIATLYIVIHLPILLFQGVLVLFLCFAYVDESASVAAGKPVIFWLVIVTVWNAIWLWSLIGWKKEWPEALWIGNNIALAIAGAALLLAISSGCLPELLGLAIFAGFSITSSVFDLWKAAHSYLSDAGY